MKARKTRWIGMIAVGLLLAGCGVDWFPDDSGKTFNNSTTSTTPKSPLEAFSWPTQTVAAGSLTNPPGEINVTPDITLQGTNTAGWPLSVRSNPTGTTGTVLVTTGSDTVMFLTPTDGTFLKTVKPGDILHIAMVPSIVGNTSVYTKVILGTYSTTIKMTTTP